MVVGPSFLKAGIPRGPLQLRTKQLVQWGVFNQELESKSTLSISYYSARFPQHDHRCESDFSANGKIDRKKEHFLRMVVGLPVYSGIVKIWNLTTVLGLPVDACNLYYNFRWLASSTKMTAKTCDLENANVIFWFLSSIIDYCSKLKT